MGAEARRLAPHVVVGALQRQGFYGFDGVQYQARTNRYVLRAYGPEGRFVSVAVDARDGRVVEVRPLAASGR